MAAHFLSRIPTFRIWYPSRFAIVRKKFDPLDLEINMRSQKGDHGKLTRQFPK